MLACAVLVTGCGGRTEKRSPAPPRPELFGPGPRYRPPAFGRAVERARSVRGLRCTGSRPARFLAHVEIFVDGRVVLMPAGIGIAPPHVRRGAFVVSGRCDYPLRTREPTGLVEVAPSPQLTLGDLFAVWGQPLSSRRVLSFRRPVMAFVGRGRVAGDPRRIELRPHLVVTVEVGRYVRPHFPYVFPPGLPTVRP